MEEQANPLREPSLIYNPGYYIVTQASISQTQRQGLLQALWYCLHLPRYLYDIQYLPLQILEAVKNIERSHNIVFIPPLDYFNEKIQLQFKRLPPLLFLVPDDLYEITIILSKEIDIPLGVAKFSELDNELLQKHWNQITSLFALEGPIISRPPVRLSETLDHPKLAIALARQFLERQIDPNHQWITNGLPQFSSLIDLVEIHRRVRILARVIRESTGSMEEDISKIERISEEEWPSFTLPVVIGARAALRSHVGSRKVVTTLGEEFAATQHPFWNILRLNQPYPADEQSLLNFAVTHRSLAQQAIGIQLPEVPASLFDTLRKLEAAYRADKPKAKKIWALLREIDAKALKLFNDEEIWAVTRASSVKIFSDFPLGLITFPPLATSPLQCYVPVSYRPVAPIAGAVGYELLEKTTVLLSGGFRILIAECLDPTDKIYPISKIGWTLIEEQMAKLKGVEVDIAQFRSSKELNEMLDSHNYDILILSAHGKYDEKIGVAGVMIGEDFTVGLDLKNIPSFVVLSACHVMPRGRRNFTIADVLLLKGAVAVLGTLVPVDIRRHVPLLAHLLVTISCSIRGEEPFTSLTEVWQTVQFVGALRDIVAASQELAVWAERNQDDMLIEFHRWDVEGRIRAMHLYRDVEEFLTDYTSRHGMGEKFKATIVAQSYLPETLFYVMAGRPERIVLRNDALRKMRDEQGVFDLLGRRRS